MEQGAPELYLAIASSDAEREAIYRFRYEVYVDGLRRPARLADHARRLLHEDIDAVSRLAYASASGAVVGVFRSTNLSPALLASPLATIFAVDRFSAYPPERLAISSRMMVDPQWRGTDVASRLIAFVYERCRDAEVLFDFCHCRPQLVPYYEIVGQRRYLAPFDHPEAGFQERLVLALEDTVHLARVGSPLLPFAAARPHNDTESGRWLEREFALSGISAGGEIAGGTPWRTSAA